MYLAHGLLAPFFALSGHSQRGTRESLEAGGRGVVDAPVTLFWSRLGSLCLL